MPEFISEYRVSRTNFMGLWKDIMRSKGDLAGGTDKACIDWTLYKIHAKNVRQYLVRADIMINYCLLYPFRFALHKSPDHTTWRL